MNRIFERDVTQEYRRIWQENVPKVLQIAKDETTNSAVQSLLADEVGEFSDGKLLRNSRCGNVFVHDSCDS